MKKLFSIFILLSLYLNISISLTYAAVTEAPSPTPKESVIEKQINTLTNKIASKVAQLKLVQRRGVIGIVTEVSNTQITVNGINGNTIFIDVDEFTKFASPTSKSSFGISDIKRGDKLGILGLYNKESRRILARFVDVLDLPQVIHGAISSIDSDNYTLTIKTEDKSYSVDVQSSTKTVAFDPEEKGLVKSGFSKLEVGQNILIVGYPSLKDVKFFEASRIIVVLGVPPNPKIKITIPSASPIPSPTPKKKT